MLKQLAQLNVVNGLVDPGALIYAPGAAGANPNGYATIGAIIAEADGSLAAHGYTPSGAAARPYQEALKNALDAANNDRTFVQPGPASCPAPLFPL